MKGLMVASARKEYLDMAERMASTHWDVTALIEWMKDVNRKEAVLSFTEGPARQVAYAFEYALRVERETTPVTPPLMLRPREQCPRCGYVRVVDDGEKC